MSLQEEGKGVKAPGQLVCEYTSNPLGVDVTRPRFSWVLNRLERGQFQSAYQVLVAISQESLEYGDGDKWDSEKVVSDDPTNITYAGSALESGKAYYWKVRT